MLNDSLAGRTKGFDELEALQRKAGIGFSNLKMAVWSAVERLTSFECLYGINIKKAKSKQASLMESIANIGQKIATDILAEWTNHVTVIKCGGSESNPKVEKALMNAEVFIEELSVVKILPPAGTKPRRPEKPWERLVLNCLIALFGITLIVFYLMEHLGRHQ